MFNSDIAEIKKTVDRVWKTVKEDVLRMGQIKSDFDWEHFTVGKEGNKPEQFLACKFHFLMRQYRFAVSEARRILIDIEEQERRLKKFDDSWYLKRLEEQDKIPECEKKRLELQHDDSIIELSNQLRKIESAERMRVRLIEMNGGKEFTNEQYQREQPAYYTWFIANEFLQAILANRFQIPVGVINAHSLATTESILPGGTAHIESLINYATGTLDLEKVIGKAIPDIKLQLTDVRPVGEKLLQG